MSRNKYVDFNNETLVRYFKDIKDTKKLSSEDEILLTKRIQSGDLKAADELVKANLKFVILVAKEYLYSGNDINDLISSGNEGIITAALKFDETKGFRFLSYAVWWIRESILRSIKNESRTIRLPIYVSNNIKVIRKAVEKFENTHGYEPSDNQIEGIKVSDLLYDNQPISIFTKLTGEGDEICDSLLCNPEIEIDPETELNNDMSLKKNISKLLDTLTDRERDIMVLYYGLENYGDSVTLESIGAKYDLTKERIRQIKSRTIRKLRHCVNDFDFNLSTVEYV